MKVLRSVFSSQYQNKSMWTGLVNPHCGLKRLKRAVLWITIFYLKCRVWTYLSPLMYCVTWSNKTCEIKHYKQMPHQSSWNSTNQSVLSVLKAFPLMKWKAWQICYFGVPFLEVELVIEVLPHCDYNNVTWTSLKFSTWSKCRRLNNYHLFCYLGQKVKRIIVFLTHLKLWLEVTTRSYTYSPLINLLQYNIVIILETLNLNHL